MNKITMMVHNMRFLLLNDLYKGQFEAIRPFDWVAGVLTLNQNEDAGGDGEDRHNYAQASKA
jgi:ribosome biogenesis protein Nip4